MDRIEYDKSRMQGYVPHPTIEEEDAPTWVYVFRSGDQRFFKIGVTQHPRGRRAQLQNSNPNPITIWFLTRLCDRKKALFLEKELHNHFTYKRLNGEWFDLGPKGFDSLIEKIEAVFEEYPNLTY